MESEKYFYLVYVSSAVNQMTSEELLTLLDTARRNNIGIGITGMLLHKDGNFMQVIEGPEEQVRNLFEKIKKDPRHRGILALLEGYTKERQFADWSMGFYELNSPEVKQLPGFSEFLKAPLTSAEFGANPTRCQVLLLIFRKNMSSGR